MKRYVGYLLALSFLFTAACTAPTSYQPEAAMDTSPPVHQTQAEAGSEFIPPEEPVEEDTEAAPPKVTDSQFSMPAETLTGLWSRQDTDLTELTVYDQQDTVISFYITSRPGENMETVCALVQDLPLQDGSGSFSYLDSHGNKGHGTITLAEETLVLELWQDTPKNEDSPLNTRGVTDAAGIYTKTAELSESGAFTTLEDGEHLLSVFNGWFMERDGQLMALVALLSPQLYTEETVFSLPETGALPCSQYGLDDVKTYGFDYSEERQAVWCWMGSPCLAYDEESGLWAYCDGGFLPYIYRTGFTWIAAEEDAAVTDLSGIDDWKYEDLRTFFEKDRRWADYQSYQMHLTVEQGVVTQAKTRYYE